MSDSTVCDVNGIFILRPMKKRENEKRTRGFSSRFPFGDVSVSEDVRQM